MELVSQWVGWSVGYIQLVIFWVVTLCSDVILI
jgi:hypothetical protein